MCRGWCGGLVHQATLFTCAKSQILPFTRHWSALPDVAPAILDKPKLLGVPNPSHYSNWRCPFTHVSIHHFPISEMISKLDVKLRLPGPNTGQNSTEVYGNRGCTDKNYSSYVQNKKSSTCFFPKTVARGPETTPKTGHPWDLWPHTMVRWQRLAGTSTMVRWRPNQAQSSSPMVWGWCLCTWFAHTHATYHGRGQRRSTPWLRWKTKIIYSQTGFLDLVWMYVGYCTIFSTRINRP